MAFENRGRRAEGAVPQVNPLAAIESLGERLRPGLSRFGEQRAAYLVLALAFAVATVLILVWGRGQTFVNDEWSYLVNYRSWSLESLVTPQNGHLLLVPLLVYKSLFATVGADSHVPYQVTTIVLHFTVAMLFFYLVRSRLPLAVATALTVLVIFFGAGWDTIMGAYEIPNLTGMASGLGMLLALERRSRGGDIAACLLLAVSLASFSVGIAFALGALFAIWLGGRTEWKRVWIVLAPAILYVIWFLWARKFDQSQVTAEAVSSLFSGAAAQLAAICAAVTGLFRVPGSAGLPELIEIRPEWGYPLAVVLGGLVAMHVARAPRSIRFWAVAGILVAYLALVAVGLSPARAPNASRYVYMGGILTLLLIAELCRDIRWSTAVGLVAFVFLGLSLMANVAELRAGGHLFGAEGDTNRATLTALELSRDRVDPDLPVEDGSTTHSHPDMFFPAWAYFSAADEFGSPAYSVEGLLGAGAQAREAADQELVRALGIVVESDGARGIARRGPSPEALAASAGTSRPLGPCLALIPNPGATATFQVQAPPGGLSLRTAPGAEIEVKLARFADLPVESLGAVTGSGEVAIPRDAAPTPWRAELVTETKTLACHR